MRFTKQEIGDILQKMRQNAGYTQKQAAESLGRKQQTLASWETGQSQPDADTLFLLCDLYGVSVNDAFGFSTSEKLTSIESRHMAGYRSLDAHGKEAIDKLMSVEVARMEQEAAARAKAEEASAEPERAKIYEMPRPAKKPKMEIVKVYTQFPASAGTGGYLDDYCEWEEMSFPETAVPYRTDFGLLITGDSMEPDIEDGAIAFVESTPDLYDGEVGIFIFNNEAFCKRLVNDDRKRETRLVSDNKKYKDIVVREWDELHIIGRVLNTWIEE